MRRVAGVVPSGLLAAVLVAGCSGSAPVSYRATFGTCYALGLQAIQRHMTVTSEPQACTGLSREQVNLAVATAVREAVGPAPKAVARHLAEQDSAYLAEMIRTVEAPAPAPSTAASARTSSPRPPGSSGLPLSLAALAGWLVTAAAGAYLLAGWLTADGRRRRIRSAGMVSGTVLGHFGLAAAGLIIWIAFMLTRTQVLAWAAVGLIIGVAGLGMGALGAALPDPGATSTRARMPVTVIALHGMLATATILLVLLAAIGAG
jgi:manganese efflux pump family protein